MFIDLVGEESENRVGTKGDTKIGVGSKLNKMEAEKAVNDLKF